jgi:N-acetylglucosamine-6-phosphate deacetylase
MRVSTHAADYLGLADRGRLAAGAWGDAVVLDRDLQLKDVFVQGASVELAHAA